MGNIIQNTTDQGLNGRIDLVKLYNKVGYLKDINTPKRPKTALERAREKPDTVKQPPNNYALKGLLRLLMSMRSITATYNINSGTILPGFLPSPNMFGMDNQWNAPGWDSFSAARTRKSGRSPHRMAGFPSQPCSQHRSVRIKPKTWPSYRS
ncbi:MAG: hypothetical protein WDN75_03815 [Bacteroidota bacterium]